MCIRDRKQAPVLLTDDSNTTSFDDINFSGVKKGYIIGGEKVVGIKAARQFIHALRK